MRADEAGGAGYQHSVVGHRRQSRILPGPAALSGPAQLKSRLWHAEWRAAVNSARPAGGRGHRRLGTEPRHANYAMVNSRATR